MNDKTFFAFQERPLHCKSGSYILTGNDFIKLLRDTILFDYDQPNGNLILKDEITIHYTESFSNGVMVKFTTCNFWAYMIKRRQEIKYVKEEANDYGTND